VNREEARLELDATTLRPQDTSLEARAMLESDAELAAWSHALVARLMSFLEAEAQPRTLALFGGLRNEPDLITDFLPWLRSRGWRTALFAVQDGLLIPYEVHGSQELQRGSLGVWEPLQENRSSLPLEELSLLLIPGLAFSREKGTRMGRGGGYYDRLISDPRVHARRIGICFELQLRDPLPAEPHDARVPQLVTEQACYHWEN
jgi:5-formyltetrahydrofolate cyclo-ligase